MSAKEKVLAGCEVVICASAGVTASGRANAPTAPPASARVKTPASRRLRLERRGEEFWFSGSALRVIGASSFISITAPDGQA
ncbi:hypothetical protein D3C87_2056490 [compost metagenome]